MNNKPFPFSVCKECCAGSDIVIDAELSTTSENPVQNKVIKAELDKKLDKSMVDSELSETSENPIQNKAIKTELDKKLDEKRVNHGGEATETWDINISGKANEATFAEYAFTDSQGNNFSSYTKTIVAEQAEDKSVKLTEWSINGPKESGLSEHSFATPEYVEEKLSNTRNYPYNVVNMNDIFATLEFNTNTVTHVYGGPTESGILTLQLHGDSGKNEIEETVLILDLSSLTTTPMIQIEGGIKWLNGEPPELAAGKVYMFSFVLAKGTTSNASFHLGIGGEFA
jgi:hypothetical protein